MWTYAPAPATAYTDSVINGFWLPGGVGRYYHGKQHPPEMSGLCNLLSAFLDWGILVSEGRRSKRPTPLSVQESQRRKDKAQE